MYNNWPAAGYGYIIFGGDGGNADTHLKRNSFPDDWRNRRRRTRRLIGGGDYDRDGVFAPSFPAAPPDRSAGSNGGGAAVRICRLAAVTTAPRWRTRLERLRGRAVRACVLMYGKRILKRNTRIVLSLAVLYYRHRSSRTHRTADTHTDIHVHTNVIYIYLPSELGLATRISLIPVRLAHVDRGYIVHTFYIRIYIYIAAISSARRIQKYPIPPTRFCKISSYISELFHYFIILLSHRPNIGHSRKPRAFY